MRCAFCGKASAPGNAAAAQLRYGKIETKEGSQWKQECTDKSRIEVNCLFFLTRVSLK